MKNLALFIISVFFLNACGVKGRPLPPETPREIGIGKPLYKGVDKELNESKKKAEKKNLGYKLG